VGTELVERGAALAALAGCLRAVHDGGGHIVLVAGEAGIGKTSVLRAFARENADLTVWWGACDALHTPHPLAPLHDIARECRPRFAALLGGPRPALFDAVLDELRLAGAPVLVVIEDAHWADDATLDWLKFLGRRIERTRALLAVSFRDDEVGTSHPLRRVIGELPAADVTRLQLPRLSPGGVEALARRAAQSAEGVHAATGGNPFFVTEVLRHGGADGAPRTVQDLVLARYAQLGDAAQALVRLVAVVPGRTERWLVDALLAPEVADVEAALASGLLVAEDLTLAFRHELGRVAVESMLSAPVVQAQHAQVLAALSATGRDTAPARLVHHALRAHDTAAVSRYAPLAARQAAERGARREAAAQWATALRDGVPANDEQRRQWLEQFAVESGTVGRFDDALQARRTLEADARARGDIADTANQLSRQAVVHIGRMRHDEADALNRQALALLEPLPPGPVHAVVWYQEAYLRMLNRDCEDSVAWARRALALAETVGDEPAMVASRAVLGTAQLFLDYPQGIALMQQALAEQLAAHRLQPAAVTLGNLGSGSGEVMQLVNAERWLREALALAVANEFDNQAYYCRAWLALTSLQRGRWDEAAAWAGEVVQQAGVADMSKLMALLALGRLRVRRGDPGADAALAEGLALTGEHNTLQRIAPLRAARAEAALARGDAAAATAEVAAGLPLAVAHRHPWLIGDLAYWGWRAGALSEPPPGCAPPQAFEIRGDWRAAAQAWQQLDCPFEQARALAEGDTPAQREALAIFERLGAHPAAEAVRQRLKAAGAQDLPPRPRGPRASTREQAFGLTTRELQVLQLLCDGLRNAEIAQRLHRSVRTVDHHLAAVFAKLGVDSRVAAIQTAQRHGLVTPSAQSGQSTRAI
jgi:DNA-binding CsgD family transcriptional regulator